MEVLIEQLGQYVNVTILIIVVMAVQGLKKTLDGFNVPDWVFIAATFGFTLAAFFTLPDAFGVGKIHTAFMNGLGSMGFYSFAKRIPVLNKMLFSNEGDDEGK